MRDGEGIENFNGELQGPMPAAAAVRIIYYNRMPFVKGRMRPN